jgi:AcrR family transcriptional regulator
MPLDNAMDEQEGSSPPKTSPSRQERRDRTRSRLLDIALDQFAAKGFEGTSIRDIAAEAGVNHGMIKYYFDNKDRLWRAAVTLLFERMERELAGPHPEDEGADSLQKVKNRLRRYVRYCARHPEHARIMIQESIRENSRLAWAVERFIAPQHEAASKVRSEEENTGIWPNISAASLSYIVVASCQMPFVLAQEIKHLYGVDMLHEAQIEAHADAVVDFLLEHNAKS